MKKVLFTLLLALVAFINVDAQPRRSVCRFKLSDNSRLAVSIDERFYDKQGKSITIGDLPAGRHYIKIYKYVPYRDGGGRAREVYRGGIRISSGTISNFTYDLNDGKLYANTEFIDDSYRNDNSDDAYNNNRPDDRRRDNSVFNQHNWNQTDMDDLKKRVDDRITDGDKIKLMESVLKNRNYTTDQMRVMLNWLSFDDSKVTLAKWGYDYVSNKENYWKLESEFTFSSSKEEFNNYISSKR
jgi:hypothetical protein